MKIKLILLALVALICLSSCQKPTAVCRDGSKSYSQHNKGTCSHHGGVAYWEQEQE